MVAHHQTSGLRWNGFRWNGPRQKHQMLVTSSEAIPFRSETWRFFTQSQRRDSAIPPGPASPWDPWCFFWSYVWDQNDSWGCPHLKAYIQSLPTVYMTWHKSPSMNSIVCACAHNLGHLNVFAHLPSWWVVLIWIRWFCKWLEQCSVIFTYLWLLHWYNIQAMFIHTVHLEKADTTDHYLLLHPKSKRRDSAIPPDMVTGVFSRDVSFILCLRPEWQMRMSSCANLSPEMYPT